MIIHIALFKWKPKITPTQIRRTLFDITALQHKVPGIIAIYAGKNYHKMSKGFTHGVVIVADSKNALRDYRTHIDHVTIAKTVDRSVTDGLGFDFKSI